MAKSKPKVVFPYAITPSNTTSNAKDIKKQIRSGKVKTFALGMTFTLIAAGSIALGLTIKNGFFQNKTEASYTMTQGDLDAVNNKINAFLDDNGLQVSGTLDGYIAGAEQSNIFMKVNKNDGSEYGIANVALNLDLTSCKNGKDVLNTIKANLNKIPKITSSNCKVYKNINNLNQDPELVGRFRGDFMSKTLGQVSEIDSLYVYDESKELQNGKHSGRVELLGFGKNSIGSPVTFYTDDYFIVYESLENFESGIVNFMLNYIDTNGQGPNFMGSTNQRPDSSDPPQIKISLNHEPATDVEDIVSEAAYSMENQAKGWDISL